MAYLEDHSLRFELDRVLRDRIEATARRVLQIGLFERIGVFRDGSGEGANRRRGRRIAWRHIRQVEPDGRAVSSLRS